jgi:hypothetical protein
MRFRRARRLRTALGVVAGAVIVTALVILGAGQARAAASGAPLAGPSSATLTERATGEWTTTVPLDTAALCVKTNGVNVPAGNKFILVTSVPDTATGAAPPAYYPASKTNPGYPACDTVTDNPVTQVTLTFRPGSALTAVPQGATLNILPPQAQLTGGASPDQVPLTVRRIVSPWQYVGVPGIFGGGLVVALVLALMAFGMPDAQAPPPAPAPPPGKPKRTAALRRAGFLALVLGFLMTGRLRTAGTAEPGDGARQASSQRPPAARPGPQPKPKRLHGGLAFWGIPLFAGATWSFSDSWVTSIAPLGALAGGVATASGAVSGLVPGVDLGRFGLLMALAGGLPTLAPLVFGALSAAFKPKPEEVTVVQKDEVFAARLWVMLVAAGLTVFAIGTEVGFVGLVLGHDLLVASPWVRWCAPAVACTAALLFLAYSVHSIIVLAGQPMGHSKATSKKRSFMI